MTRWLGLSGMWMRHASCRQVLCQLSDRGRVDSNEHTRMTSFPPAVRPAQHSPDSRAMALHSWPWEFRVLVPILLFRVLEEGRRSCPCSALLLAYHRPVECPRRFCKQHCQPAVLYGLPTCLALQHTAVIVHSLSSSSFCVQILAWCLRSVVTSPRRQLDEGSADTGEAVSMCRAGISEEETARRKWGPLRELVD